MISQCLVLIRHAEKPSNGQAGVGEDGRHEAAQLTVRGWQRAGALARFFVEPQQHCGIDRPVRILAPASTAAHPSLRGLSTALPLARRLGLPVDTSFEVGQEGPLAERLATFDGCTLVVWQHAGLPHLLHARLPADPRLPARWPEERFDLTWLLPRADAAAPWRFEQRPQCLLDGDQPDPIAV
jgi:hypothetical protein